MAIYRVRKGCGPHVHNGERYAPGDTFEAEPAGVENFGDKLERLDTESAPNLQPKDPGAALLLRPRGAGWFDVVNPATGQPINERGLRKAEAEQLAEAGIPPTEADEPEAGADG